MKSFSLLIKPSSADCNLECEYCFYLEKKELYPETRRHQMSDAVLESLVSGYLSTPQPVHTFGWQGGEPTLMGRVFFRRVTDLEEHYGRRGAVVSNGLQTNGTLLTDELCAHLASYRFLVGLSIDGPEEVHDANRRRPSGRGSYRDVLRGMELLKRHSVEFNVLTVVSQANVRKPAQVYDHLRELGLSFHQYIPCVEFRPDGEPEPYAISGREWGEFLLGIFEKWSSGDSERVSVRHFDSILSLLVDDRVTSCILSRACNDYFVVEWNGDVYPCDFFVEPQKRLGNVLSESWSDFEGSEIRRRFAAAKSQWSSECARCPYLRFCAGDCQKMRYRTSENPRQLSWLCEGWKLFYEQTLPEFRKIARYVRSRRASVAAAPLPAGGSGPVPGGVPAAPRREPGRNDPCYCGSGKKYKHCHGR